MDEESIRYETYALAIKRMLLFAGLWPGRVSSKIFQFVVVVHVLTAISTSSAIVNFVFNHVTDLSLATKGLAIAVSFFTMILKVIVFVINRNNLVGLHVILETTFRKDLENDELRPILLSPLNFFYHSALYLSVSMMALLPTYVLAPPISIIVQISRGVRPLKFPLPFPGQYPWTIAGNGGLYVTQYIVELCAACAIAGITMATDALFGFYVFQMSSQFRTISYRINDLKASDDHYSVIRECALRHQILTHCRDKLERIYGPIILWMLTTSAMIICANIFQAFKVSFDKAIPIMVYIVMKLIQTFLYGWYGWFLTAESEAFRESVYCSGWAGSGERSFMSNVLTMLMYKPLTLTACHFSVISLDMFVAIVNTAFSYFFLLRTLEESN